MKLVVKNQQGENLSFDVLPEDTFHNIQERLRQNGMVILDLSKLAVANRPFSMSANVMEYFSVQIPASKSKTEQSNAQIPLINRPQIKDMIVERKKTKCEQGINLEDTKMDTKKENPTKSQTEPDECVKECETIINLGLKQNENCEFGLANIEEDTEQGIEINQACGDTNDNVSNDLHYDCLNLADKIKNSWQEHGIINDLKNKFDCEEPQPVSETVLDSSFERMPLCRLCAEEIYDDEPFYIHETAELNGITLADKINACLPIVVTPKDNLPKQICAECMLNLEASFHFSQSVTSAEDKLHSFKPKCAMASNPCPLCFEGCLTTVGIGKDQEYCSSDESTRSITDPDWLDEKKHIRAQEGSNDNSEQFPTKTGLPIMNRKRGRPRKYHHLYEDDDDGCDTEEPVEKKRPTRGRPRGSKNFFSKPKNLNCFICLLKLKDYKESLLHTLEAHCDEINKTFPCPLCENTFTSEQELQVHIDTHNGTKEMVIVSCCLCEMVFHRLRDINEHWKEKHEKPLMMHCVCPICELTDMTAAGLASHVVSEHATHDNNNITCPLCLQGYDEESKLHHHFEENHIEKPEAAVVCSECDVKLASETEYSRHVVEAHCTTAVLKKPSYYTCSECGNNFRSQYFLIKHTCSAECEELYCKLCMKEFPTKARFVFHQQSHHPEFTEMRCHECWLFFTDEDTFYDHVRFQHEPDDQQQCPVCEKMFKNNISLQMHMKRHIPSRNHPCSKCGKKFQTPQTLREHLVSHMEVKPYQCHICGLYLSRLSRLRMHLRGHSANNFSTTTAYKCSHCKQLFANKKKADTHLKTHDGSESVTISPVDVSLVFRCEFCDAGFHLATHLKQHRLDKHSNQDSARAYTCPVCGAQFPTYARVTTHKLTHGINTESLIVPPATGEKPLEDMFAVPQYFLCHECDKRSLHYTYLSLHRRFQHAAGSSIHECDICSQKFATAWSYHLHKKKVHSVQHEVNSVHHCQHCGKPYMTETSLEAHVRRFHTTDDNSSFICETCGKTFHYKALLDAHTDAHRGWKRFACSECKRRFTHRAGLIRHMKLHSDEDPFDCEFCGKKFRDKSERENHRRSHTGERPFMCHVCGRTFHTRAVWLDHSRIHEDVKPFRCDECGQSFRRSYALKSHYLIHTGEKPFPCEYCGEKFRLRQSVFAHKKKEHRHLFNDDLNENIAQNELLIDDANRNEELSLMEDSEADNGGLVTQRFKGSEHWLNESKRLSSLKNSDSSLKDHSDPIEQLPDQGFGLLIV